MEGSNSIINLGDISKPANTLVKKISEAIGGIFKPNQIRRVAEAEAEADKIRTISQIEISELQFRATQRFVVEEAKKQNNIESITSKAFPMLNANADPEKIEDDWITNYFDKCRLISDEEMQILWSKILAGESNSPGIFSKRTIDLLASMDKNDAELFSKLCDFNFKIFAPTPLIYDYSHSIYKSNGINFGILSHLESIGLIQFNHITGFIRKSLREKGYLNYFDEKIWIEFSKPEDNEMKIGNVSLTLVGMQLSKVSESNPVPGFRDYIKDKWQNFGYKVFDNPPADEINNA